MGLPITQDKSELQTVVGLSAKYGKSDSALKESYRLARQTAQWQNLPTPLSISTALTEMQIAFFEWKYGAVGQTVTRQTDKLPTVIANRQTDNDAAVRQTEADRQELETEIRQELETEIRQIVSKEFQDRQDAVVRQTETDTANRLRTEYEDELRIEKDKTAKAVADRQQTEREAADKLRETESKYTQLVQSERDKTKLAVSSALSQKELELRANLTGTLDSKMSDKQKEYATELATERRRIETDYKDRLGSKQTELDSLSKQLATAVSDLAVVSERLKRTELDKTDLLSQLSEMSERVGNAQTDKGSLSVDLTRAQMEKANLSERLQTALSELSEMSGLVGKLESDELHLSIQEIKGSFDDRLKAAVDIERQKLQMDNEKVFAMKENSLIGEYQTKLQKEFQTFNARLEEKVKNRVSYLEKEINYLYNEIAAKENLLNAAYKSVNYDPEAGLFLTNPNLTHVFFAVIGIVAALVSSNVFSEVAKALIKTSGLEMEIPTFGMGWCAIFVIALVIQFLGFVVSVTFNRNVVEKVETVEGVKKKIVTVSFGKEPIWATVIYDVIIELSTIVLICKSDMDWHVIIPAFLMILFLPTAHFTLSKMEQNILKTVLEKRINYGLPV